MTTVGGGTSTTVAAKRIAAYITKVDVNEGELTYDEIAFLTGDAANAAYRRDNPDDPNGVPNDYYIDNPDKTAKTVAIASNARVELNILHGGELEFEQPGSQRGGSLREPEVIAEAHLDAPSILAGISRFARERDQRMGRQRDLLTKLL